jgi:hypothetical protein
VSLRDADEQYHRPPEPLPANWQENLFLVLWDVEHQHGFMTHVQRVPGRGVQEARLVVGIGGRTASATCTGPYELERTVDAVTIEVVEPFRELSVRASFAGVAGPGPFGILAAHPGGDVPVVVELTLRSDVEPIDFAPGLAAMTARLRADATAPQMGDQAHYETGGRWSGVLRIGDEEVRASGLFVRDHSRGERHERNGFQAFWTATCLDDGRAYANAIGIPAGDGWVGIGAISDERGVRFTDEVHAEFSPGPGLLRHDRTVVTYGPGVDLVVRGETQAHWPIALPYSGRDRYDDNALSVVEAGGRRGFSVMEWAATLTPEQTSELETTAATPG